LTSQLVGCEITELEVSGGTPEVSAEDYEWLFSIDFLAHCPLLFPVYRLSSKIIVLHHDYHPCISFLTDISLDVKSLKSTFLVVHPRTTSRCLKL
jgi:hypothetical protein